MSVQSEQKAWEKEERRQQAEERRQQEEETERFAAEKEDAKQRERQPLEGQQAEVEPQAAPAPGTAILGTATIDSLFTLMFATRSGDLGAASYAWADSNSIIATFPAGTTPTAVNASMMKCRFEARPNAPSVIAP
jgi:hypothetical protein